MRIRPRGAAEDCCCSSLKNNVKWLMERIGGTVRKLIINGSEYTPDGDGTVTLDTSAFVDVDDHLDDDSMKPIANKPVAEAIDALDDEDSRLDGRIDYIAGVVSGVSAEVGQLQTDVSGQGSQIGDLQGSIAGLAADNSYTRGVARAAKDTADGMGERLTDVETNDAVQQSQIGQLIVADQASAKLAGDNAFTGQNSFAVNPKAAAPASGAVDTSVVNANWVSQTGDDAPNNLVHKTGLETIPGEKIISNLWGNPITNPNGVWNALIKLTVSTRDIEINLLISDRYGCALIHFAFNHTTHEYTRKYYVSAGTVNAAIGITEIEGAYYICAKTTVNSYVNIMPLSCMSGAYHLVTLPVQIALGSSATIYDADIWNVST